MFFVVEHKQYKQQRRKLENLHKKAQYNIDIIRDKNYNQKEQLKEQKTRELYAYGEKMTKYIKELENKVKTLENQLNNASNNQMQTRQIERGIKNNKELIKKSKSSSNLTYN